MGQPGGHLYHVHRVPAAGGMSPDEQCVFRVQGQACLAEHRRRSEPVPGSRGRKNTSMHRERSAGGSSSGARVVAPTRRKSAAVRFRRFRGYTGGTPVLGIVIGRFKAHFPVLQHLEQLVHLNGMQLPDFVQEQYAPMGPGHRLFLGLGHPADAQLARP